MKFVLQARQLLVALVLGSAAVAGADTGSAWKSPDQLVEAFVELVLKSDYSTRMHPVRKWTTPIRYTLIHRVGEEEIHAGLVSTHLAHRAAPGTLVMLDQATGDFVLPSTAPAKVLFLTAGSGITPVMGMLRNRLADLRDVVLVHSAPTAADVVFGDELRALAATGAVTLLERHTDIDGMLAVTELDTLVPDWRERETWACGPTGLLDALEGAWAQAGVAERLHTERFRPTVLVVGEGGTLTFTSSGVTVEADGGRPILDSAEEAGVLMPSGCRMGICFRCVLPLREGAVRDLRTGGITYAVAGDGTRIQTCISAPAGDCQIEH